MTANPPQTPTPTEDGFPTYPGFGSREDILARMQLLDWICQQVGNRVIETAVGDYVLATDDRILGVGQDAAELHRNAVEVEPDLRNARLVGYRVPLTES